MVNIEKYIQQLSELLRKQFSSRLLYVGLQGSYLRGEANSDSDIDIMVVIADLNVSDLTLYRKIINALEYSEKSCGFICSTQDLCHWNPLEICSLLHTTKDYYGTLREFTPDYSEADLRNFLKIA